MILTYMINTNKKIKLTKGQGHKAKGQGQINSYVKKVDSFILIFQLSL